MNAPGSVSAVGTVTEHRAAIVLSAMLAAVMQALDATIANVALPRIQGTLSATQDQMSWVLTSYIVATAITMPLSGWLASRVGRRRVFLSSIVGFTVTSAMCGIANSLPEMVMFRFLQGACGAALIPLSQAVTLDITPPHRHASAMAFWVMGVTVGPIVGPALGGWLTEVYNWRWVFYINVPLGIIAFVGVATFMPETAKRRSSFDIFGFATLSIAIAALQLVLDRGQRADWFESAEICIEAGVSLLAAYLFVVHTLTATRPPFVSPDLFRDRNFVTGCLFLSVIGVVLFATLALLPPLLQDLMDYPVVLTGLVTAPRGAGTLFAMIVVGRLSGRVDGRVIIVVGCLITAWSLWMMTRFHLQMDTGLVVWSGLMQGFGTGFVYVSLAAMSFATLAPVHRNEGTAIFSLVRNLGSSVGISVVETLFARHTQIMHSRLAEHLTPFSHGLNAVPGLDGVGHAALAKLNGQVTMQAAMIAYDNQFQMMMVLSLGVIPFVLLLRATRKSGPAQAVAVE